MGKSNTKSTVILRQGQLLFVLTNKAIGQPWRDGVRCECSYKEKYLAMNLLQGPWTHDNFSDREKIGMLQGQSLSTMYCRLSLPPLPHNHSFLTIFTTTPQDTHIPFLPDLCVWLHLTGKTFLDCIKWTNHQLPPIKRLTKSLDSIWGYSKDYMLCFNPQT